VTNPMPMYDQNLGTTRVIDLSAFFADPDATAAAKLTTPFGSMTITLDGLHAPMTVINFLNYISSGRYFVVDPTNGDIASSFVHRSVSGFVIQGGGFLGTVNPNGTGTVQPLSVTTFPAVQNEPFISNIRGTFAMAKFAGDPNSATSQWFINLANNSANLDVQNGGFTVFGHVTGSGMSVADTIAALPRINAGSAFSELPVRDYVSGNPVRVQNLVSISELRRTSPLNYTASSNNPDVASVSVSEGNLSVNALQMGSAGITVTAFDLDGAGPVSQSFTVNIVAAAPVAMATAASRKDHGPAGAFDINLPVSGSIAVECRTGGPEGNHTLVFGFNNTVVSGTATVSSGSGTVLNSPQFTGNTMTVNLTGVTNAQVITVVLSKITDTVGQVLPDTSIHVGFLLGDTNGNQLVNSSDVGQTKSQSGSAVTASNFRADVIANGVINATDIGQVKAQSGTSLP
jgi:cyclophilin family peptidyl-prolyl cis-trans isomerase